VREFGFFILPKGFHVEREKSDTSHEWDFLFASLVVLPAGFLPIEFFGSGPVVTT
jgi:hypothetical protein